MELFLDDPNIDVETKERNYIVRSYTICLLISVIPSTSAIVAYILSHNNKFNSCFSKQHLSKLLTLQIIVFVCSIVAVLILLSLGSFYFYLFVLFIILFQSVYTYKGISAAKAGVVNALTF